MKYGRAYMALLYAEVTMRAQRRSILTARLPPIKRHPPLPPLGLAGKTVIPKGMWSFDHKASQAAEHEACLERLRAESRKTNIIGGGLLSGLIILAVEIVRHLL